MTLIYEPKGKAREYSPLALNIYNGCDFGCKYCYTKLIKRSPNANLESKERTNFLNNLEKELSKTQHNVQILLSFMCDPYCSLDDELKTTRMALRLLNRFDQKVAILTKSGSKCLRDIDIYENFDKRLKVGATLTFLDNDDSINLEPGAASPASRLETLEYLHKNGVKTFVSIEPVIDTRQSLELIESTVSFVDQYKIGKINHFEKKFTDNINWTDFLNEAIIILRKCDKQFYIKEDLAKFDNNNILLPHEKDYNYLNL